MEAESRRCVSCHDGVFASDATNPTIAGSQRGSWMDTQRHHPVGVLFPNVQKKPGQTRYRHPRAVPSNIRLLEGWVSCVSCHDLYSGAKRLLSVPTEGSALCFGCHALD